MSADIRNFFISKGKKPASSSTATAQPSTSSPATQKKRKALVISSDEDEPISSNNNKKTQNKTTTPKSKPTISRSPSKSCNGGKPNLKKLKSDDHAKGKLVNVSDIFGSEPAVKKPIEPVRKPKDEPDPFEEELDESILDDLDCSIFEDATVASSNTVVKIESPKKTKDLTEKTNKNEGHSRESPARSLPEPKVASARKRKSTKSSGSAGEPSGESQTTDEDRYAKKRMSAVLYQQFKNRGGPPHPGSKELPKGKPDCLSGLTFVISGVLDSLERDEAAALIKEHGGKTTTSISGRTSYMLLGTDAGLQKTAKAEEMKVPMISEDELLNLIRKKSGIPMKKAESVEVKSETIEIKTEKHKDSHKAVNRKGEKASGNIKKEKRCDDAYDTEETKHNGIKIAKTQPLVKREGSKDIEINRPVSEYQNDIASIENQAWVEKYKPTSVKQIIGQQGASSNVAKLTNWLTKWYVNQQSSKRAARPNPWAKNDDGAYYKAALLSGPPGVGKTTTATLVCKELGFDTVEFNASDTRSKRLLKEEVSELLSNTTLHGYFTVGGQGESVSSKHVLIMDEVDGMAGNEDRGGMQELIALIKESSVPIICMCNDRNHQKMRSLVTHCYDLRFQRPKIVQIRGAMMSICFKENIKLAPNVVDEVIAATNNDIRQTLNHLTLLSASKSLTSVEGTVNKVENTAKKDMKLGPWDVVRLVFSKEEQKTMSLQDKANLFFNDYSLGPLFVQQNYLSVAPDVTKLLVPKQVALTADSLSLGDLVESRIRSKNAWSMLPIQAMFSSVMPGEYMKGRFTGQINFPGWLGKYSKTTKRKRLAQEIHDHTRVRTSGSRLSVRLDYAPFLLQKIVLPLKERGIDGVDEAIAVLKEYHLLREDIDALIELSAWPGKKSAFDGVDSKVKAALTRTYNKTVAPYSYSAISAVKKKRATLDELEEYGNEEETTVHSSDDGEDDDVNVDALIKPVVKKTSRKAEAGSKKPTASKAGISGRGKNKSK